MNNKNKLQALVLEHLPSLLRYRLENISVQVSINNDSVYNSTLVFTVTVFDMTDTEKLNNVSMQFCTNSDYEIQSDIMYKLLFDIASDDYNEVVDCIVYAKERI